MEITADTLSLLRQARDLLQNLTPLRNNCGGYCGAACCKADESGENGMLLFPGEEKFYEKPSFACRLFPDDTLFHGGKRLVCEGICRREERPLACRLFPLRLKVREKDGTLLVKPEIDPRSWCVCPLPERGGMRGMDPAFTQACLQAGKLLLKDAALREALQNEQRMLDETRVL